MNEEPQSFASRSTGSAVDVDSMVVGEFDQHTFVLDTPEAGGRVIRGTALRTLSLAIGIVLSVGSTALLTRHLGVAQYGQFLTVMSLLMIAAGLSEAGLDNMGVREYTNLRGEARDRAMRSLIGMRLTLAMTGSALAFVFAAIAYDSTMAFGTLLGAVGIVAVAMNGALNVQLLSSLRLGWVAAAELLRQVLLVSAIVILVLAGAGLLLFLGSWTPASIGMLVFTMILVRGRIPFRPAFHGAEWGRLIRDALPFALATAAGIVYYRVAIILMSLISSKTQTGYFGASFRVVEILTIVPPLLAASAFPVLARAVRGDEVRFRYAIGRMLEVAVLAGAGFAVAVVIGAPLAIDVIGGSDFEPSIALLRIQGLVLLSTFFIATFAYALLALRRYRTVMVANATAVALVAALTLVLVPLLDATGAAIAMVVSEATLASIYASVLLRKHQVSFPVRTVPRVALAAALALATLLIPGLPTIAALALAAVLFIGASALLGAVPNEIWAALAARRTDAREP